MSLEKGNKQDYRDTLLLPKTDLPMRANLPDKEPEFLKKWSKESYSQKSESHQRAKKNLFCMMVLPMQTEIYIWVPL